MMRPCFVRFLCTVLFCGWTVLSYAEEAPLVVPGDTLVEDVTITMRDGVNLLMDIRLPEGDWPFPVILWRSPYDKKSITRGAAEMYVKAGFATVGQDCRGRYKSEGEWDPFRYEARDGEDTVEWIGKQEWCNGKIGLAGGSYLGFTQCINAPNGSKYLATMNPIVPWGNTYHDCIYWGGALRMHLTFYWGGIMQLGKLGLPVPHYQDEKLFETLPLQEWDKCLGVEVPYLRDWVAHPTHDDYWRDHEVGDKIENVQIPALYFGGWFDIFQNGVIDYWNAVRTRAKSEEARKRQYLIMGPWAHGISPGNGVVGDLKFGSDSNINPGLLSLEWYKETLLGEDHGFSTRAPLRIFVMGANVWRDEYEWPLARTQYRNLYLGASEPANSAFGGGTLTWEKGGDALDTDTFVYDPTNPVPTHGGALLSGEYGPREQFEIEERDDVLVYSTEILEETVEVTGPIRLVLYAASTAPDTDFTGKLIDVCPDQYGDEVPYAITDGILRASFRESDTHPTPIEPGKVYRYEINLGATSNAFRPGHRIGIQVSSSNFPRFDRNPNTGHPFGSDDILVSATQTIHHSEVYASHLVLPVIPQ